MIMRLITAPYGFVPLSKTVVFPGWLQPKDDRLPPLHDVPFQDGLCGTLTLEIESETPLFIRGARKKELPFQLQQGHYAIPATALRGALRNVVEILTFSRFQRINRDHRYAVRDLQNRNLYGQYMAEIVKNPRTGKGEPMPLVNAGWLSATRDEEGRWNGGEIEVCDFGKIEYRPLEEIARQLGIRGYQPGNKQTSVEKYIRWLGEGRSPGCLDVTVHLDVRRPGVVGRRKMASQFGLAVPNPSGQAGTLVFTGQPSRWTPDPLGKRRGAGNAKHHDFVFLPQATKRTLKVDQQTFEDFEFAHSDRGQQNRLGRSQTPNAEWGYWEKKLDEPGGRVPVFFLTDEGGEQVKAFGLAMMFRLPYKFSIGEAVRNVDPRHVLDGPEFDFAEGLFGTVRRRGDSGSDRAPAVCLKGRVGISHALAQGTPRLLDPVAVVLGAPKASYYPNYVEQDPERPGSPPRRDAATGRPLYRTWMDPKGAPRGWKRYRPLTSTWQPIPPTGGDGRPLDLSKVGTRFQPLQEGTLFQAHVDVHNLRPEELGALLWALDFGGEPGARHTLGMARPLGYGRTRLSIVNSQIRTMEGQPADLEGCRRRFEAYMDEQVPGWRRTPQIQELLALARPVPPEQAKYQRLDPGQRINEFVLAKQEGLALPSTSGAAYAETDGRGRSGEPPVQKTPAPRPADERSGDGAPRPQAPSPQPPRPVGPAKGDRARFEVHALEGNILVFLPSDGRRWVAERPMTQVGVGDTVQLEVLAVPPNGDVRAKFLSKVAAASAPATPGTSSASWPGMAKGAKVQVLLSKLTKSKEWRCSVVGYEGIMGTIRGRPSSPVAPGQQHTVFILSGGDPSSLFMGWDEP